VIYSLSQQRHYFKTKDIENKIFVENPTTNLSKFSFHEDVCEDISLSQMNTGLLV